MVYSNIFALQYVTLLYQVWGCIIYHISDVRRWCVAGAQTYPNASFGWVNVKDVANAHVQAFEITSASGRYVLVERVAHYSEIVEILRKQNPSFKLPDN